MAKQNKDFSMEACVAKSPQDSTNLQSVIIILKHARKKCNKCHGKVMEKVIERSRNVMEFGLEHCVGIP